MRQKDRDWISEENFRWAGNQDAFWSGQRDSDRKDVAAYVDQLHDKINALGESNRTSLKASCDFLNQRITTLVQSVAAISDHLNIDIKVEPIRPERYVAVKRGKK